MAVVASSSRGAARCVSVPSARFLVCLYSLSLHRFALCHPRILPSPSCDFDVISLLPSSCDFDAISQLSLLVSNRPHAITPTLSHGRSLSCGLVSLCCLFLRHVFLFSSHHGAIRDTKDLDVPNLFNNRRSNVVDLPPSSSPLSIRASLDLSRTMTIARHDPRLGFLTFLSPRSPPSLPLLRTSHSFPPFTLCISATWMHGLLSRHQSCACLCL